MARAKASFNPMEGLTFANQHEVTPSSNEYQKLPASKIHASRFNEDIDLSVDKIAAYAKSMKEVGLLHPITVYATGNGEYEIISGHQRFQAWCKVLGNETIPAIVREYEEDVRKRFAAHHEANVQNRVLDGKYWIAQIKQAQNVLSETGFSGKKEDEVRELCSMLGISKAQIYRYFAFGKLIPQLQEFESKKQLSARTLSSAVGLSSEQQLMVVHKVQSLLDQIAESESSDTVELTRDEFDRIVADVKKGESELPMEESVRTSFEGKTAKASQAFIKTILRSKTSAEKEIALQAIAALRVQLDEIEEKLKS